MNQYIDLNPIPKILLLAKQDLQSVIDMEVINSFIDNTNISKYFPTSSKTGKNVEKAFKRISQLITISSVLVRPGI
jgi:hypothetical protein